MKAAPTKTGVSPAMKAFLAYIQNRSFTKGPVTTDFTKPQPYDWFDPATWYGKGVPNGGWPVDHPVGGDPMLNALTQIGQDVTGAGQRMAPGPQPASPPGKLY